MNADTSPFDIQVRTRVYRHFVDHGVAPSTFDLAAALDAEETAIRQALERLETARSLVLSPGTRQVWMAHPFSAVPTQYAVETADRRYWANCAWDALALAPLLRVDARMRTTCPDCGESVVVSIEHGRLDAPDGAVVQFVVPPVRFWENIGFT